MQYHATPCNTLQYPAIPCIINYCWRSVPLPCGQYKAIFFCLQCLNCLQCLHSSIFAFISSLQAVQTVYSVVLLPSLMMFFNPIIETYTDQKLEEQTHSKLWICLGHPHCTIGERWCWVFWSKVTKRYVSDIYLFRNLIMIYDNLSPHWVTGGSNTLSQASKHWSLPGLCAVARTAAIGR